MRAQIDTQLLVDLSARAEACSVIDPEYFNKYIVKRGLRDIGGIGVLVGLTEIGEVHSYIIDENEMIPVPGRLMYRGIDINDIVEGFVSDNRFGFEETGYLLLFGNLPNQQQLSDFKQMLGANREPPNGFTRDAILKGPSRDIMNGMSRSILNLYMYDDE
jgi:citrate synthase